MEIAMLVNECAVSNYKAPIFDFESKNIDREIAKHVFILPIYGENELIEFYSDKLERLFQDNDFDECQFLFLLIGDVHVSDDAAFADMPITKQLRYKLRNFVEPIIYPVKLSLQRLTSDDRHFYDIHRFISSPVPNFSSHLSRLKKIIHGPFHWDEEAGTLSFMNNENGYSSLINHDSTNMVFCLAANLPIRELSLERARIKSIEELEAFRGSSIFKLNLSSNCLSSLNGLSEITPELQWLNIAANHFSCIDLRLLPKSTEVIYAHKNNAVDFVIGDVGGVNLKRISIYRNNISSADCFFEIPKLEFINVGANPIKSLPFESRAKLKYLGIAKTAITCLPDWILESEVIEEIDISYIENNLNRKHLDLLTRKGVRLIVSPFYNL